MAGFNNRFFNQKNARQYQLHFDDLNFLLIDEMNRLFEKHGNILGLCMERVSADILFKRSEDAVAAFHVESSELFHGKMLKMSLGDFGVSLIKQEPEPSESVIFLPSCDIKPKVENLDIKHPLGNLHNDHQNKQDSLNINIPESAIDMQPTISETMLQNKQNQTNYQLSQVKKEKEQRTPHVKGSIFQSPPKLFMIYDTFKSYLDELGSECSRICITNLENIISYLLETKFREYGEIKAMQVQRCFAVLQYETIEQADAACEAESCSKLFDHIFVIGRCCRANKLKNRKEMSQKLLNISAKCSHGKQKLEESKHQRFTSKRLKVENNDCQIIILANTDVEKTKYIPIKARLEEFGLKVDILFSNEDIHTTTVSTECIAIEIEPMDEQHQILKVNDKEMRLEDLPAFVVRNLISNFLTKTVVKDECSTETNYHLNHEIETNMNQGIQISDDIPMDNVENLRKNIVKLEKNIENLNVQLVMSQKRCSELETNR